MESKPCEYCGSAILAPPYRLSRKSWERRRFCSEACRRKGHRLPLRCGPARPLEERFWSKVQVCEHGLACATCCWPWIGTRNKDGYGIMYRTEQPKRTWYRAHCLSYELFIGPIPEGLHVLHNCPNGDLPACVNYNGHLWTGTQADNNRDRDAKGRAIHPKGEANHRTIVSDAQVAEIRRLYATGGYPQFKLSTMFEISESQIYRIIKMHQRT
jgi:hypothetical protein